MSITASTHHRVSPCALWISLDGLHQSHPAQLLIKSTPFCIIDSFPFRNGPHVTRIVSRLKRCWPTSAVNHKPPLTREGSILPPGISSLCLFVLGQTIVLVFIFATLAGQTLHHCLRHQRDDSLSLSGLWTTMMSGTTLKRLTKCRGSVTPQAHTTSKVRMRKWRSHNTNTYYSKTLNDTEGEVKHT